jgi:hypothetical protein
MILPPACSDRTTTTTTTTTTTKAASVRSCCQYTHNTTTSMLRTYTAATTTTTAAASVRSCPGVPCGAKSLAAGSHDVLVPTVNYEVLPVPSIADRVPQLICFPVVPHVWRAGVGVVRLIQALLRCTQSIRMQARGRGAHRRYVSCYSSQRYRQHYDKQANT